MTPFACCTIEEPVINYLLTNNPKWKQKQPVKKRLKGKDKSAQEVERQRLGDAVYLSVVGRGKVRKCYIYVAKALTLQLDDSVPWARPRVHGPERVLYRNFRTIHLDSIQPLESSTCPLCELTLDDKQHLQNHSESVYDIKTDGA